MIREFGLVVAAGLGSSVLGAGFGWLIGHFAPEFIVLLAQPRPVESPEPVATALGAIAGLAIGVAAISVVLVVSALRGRSERSS